MFKVLVIFACVAFAATQDWCNIKNCKAGTHVVCVSEKSGYGNCAGKNLVFAEITPALEAVITNTHNNFRNQVAGGSVKGLDGVYLPQANRMATVQYSKQLEKIARANAKSCTFAHDTCRNTLEYRLSGQNLYIVRSPIAETSPQFNLASIITDGVSSWFKENQYTRLSDITTYSTLYVNGQAIGHFTALANELQTHVGCAISHFNDVNQRRSHYLVCNYAFTNLRNTPVYRAGVAASKCTTGRNPVYKNLCSINEKYVL